MKGYSITNLGEFNRSISDIIGECIGHTGFRAIFDKRFGDSYDCLYVSFRVSEEIYDQPVIDLELIENKILRLTKVHSVKMYVNPHNYFEDEWKIDIRLTDKEEQRYKDGVEKLINDRKVDKQPKDPMSVDYYKGKSGLTVDFVVKDFELPWNKGQAFKYIARRKWKDKENEIKDMHKAIDNLKQYIKDLETEE